MNVNEFIFSKTRAQKKLETIQSMSNEEIRGCTMATLKRIVDECKDKYGRFRINMDRRAGNHWNSDVEGLSKSLKTNQYFVEIYVQGDSTDTTDDEYLETFFRTGEYRGSCHLGSFTYYEDDKIEVLRSILMEYVYYKYIEKPARDKAEKVKKVLDKGDYYSTRHKYYEYYDLWHKSGWGMSGKSTEEKAYYHAQKVVEEYVVTNVNELYKKNEEELKGEFDKMFFETMKEYIRTN